MKEKMVKLVIEIPEKLNNKSFAYLTEEEKQTILNAVDSGVLLPKGHGRLIDANDVWESGLSIYNGEGERIGIELYDIDFADIPTVIEADEEEE